MSRYLIFGVVAVTFLVQAMGGSAIAVAFPDVASSFDASLVLAGWVLSIYPLVTIVTIPLSGKASDALGRRRVFTFCVLLFTAGSFLCAIAPNIYWLILFRVIQGAGSGGFFTSAVGIVADAFPESRQRSVGFITSLGKVGIVAGLNVGGWLAGSYGWRSIFWFCVFGGIAAILVGAALLKRDPPATKVDFDIKGAGQFAGALGAIIAGITIGGGDMSGTSMVSAAGLLVVGAALLVIFVRHERRAENPLIDLEVLRGRPFVASNVFNATSGFTVGMFTFLPLYAVTVYGVSLLESGMMTTPRSLGMFASSVVCSFLLVRWGYRKPLVIGATLTIAASILLGFQSQGVSVGGIALGGIGSMLVLVTLSGLGHGLKAPAANNACIELMPDRVSTIIGLRSTFAHAGSALGIALATVVMDRSGSLAMGLRFVFFGAALMTLISIPFIFAMPRSPDATLQERCGKTPAAVTTESQYQSDVRTGEGASR